MTGKTIYRLKYYRCGEYLDAYCYPVVPCAKPIQGKRTRKRVSREVQTKLNQRHARERLTRIVNTNFSWEDLSMTLTYRDNPETKEEAVKELQKYIRKLRAQYKKAGIELKYVWQMEKSKKGRYHVHMILSGGIDRDKLEKFWGNGYANSKRLQFDQNGVAALVGYITKSHHNKDEERITYKAWNGSRNLIDPEPEISDTKVRSRKKALELADGEFNAWNEIFPGYEIADINQFHSDEYGSVYLFARLYRRDGKRMPPKRKVKK